MYDKILDTFLCVVENGSFTKAAEKLFISHTAVIKQINSLESQLGVKLFQRSHSGISLTSAGQLLEKKAREIRSFSEKAIQEIQNTYLAPPKTIRVGTSLFYPCHIFLDLWNTISDFCPQYTLKIVPIENDEYRLSELKESFDFLVGPYDNYLSQHKILFFPVGNYKFYLTMPRKHLLAKNKELKFTDLSDQKLMIMQSGNSKINDQIREELMNHYPKVTLEDILPNYTIETLNKCNEENAILLSLECWKEVHPGLISIPLIEDYSIPYGILTPENLMNEMDEFVKAIQDVLKKD